MDTTTIAFALVGTFIALLTGYECNTVPVHIPDDDCLISIENFTSKVVVQRWISVFDSRGYEHVFNRSSGKIYLNYTMLEDGILHLEAVYWDGDCKPVISNYTLIHDSKAIWAALPGGTFYTAHAVYRYLSSDPDKFLIMCICMTEPDANWNCHQTRIIIFIPDFHDSNEESDNNLQDTLQVIQHSPFTQINEIMVRCMNLTLEQTEIDGSHMEFDWTGQSCVQLLGD